MACSTMHSEIYIGGVQAPPQQPTDLTEDKFGPPPTPPDFQQDSNFR